MRHANDALELLLPDADAQAVGRARKVTHFLRLLSNDALPARAASVGIDLERARFELERQDRTLLEGAVRDLLRHSLDALAGAESFTWFGEAAQGWHAAWRLLDGFRDELEWLAGVPEPEESAASVAGRLVETLDRLGADAGEIALWRARLVRLRDGPRTAEVLFRDALDEAARRPGPASNARELIAGQAECLLDRGAVREAHACLMAQLALVERDVRLRHLLAWTRVCLGDEAGARSLLGGLRPWPGTLPAPLLELRTHRPRWLACLAGKALSNVRACSKCEATPVRERSELGASVLGVFELLPGNEARPLVLDVALGLRQGLDAWLHERDGACAVSNEREHRMIVTAQCIVAHRDGDTPLSGVLGRDATRALALAPILDDDGEVCGWLHVECEHHLLPSSERLRRLAQAWRGELRASQSDRPVPDARPAQASAGASAAQVGADAARDDELCAAVFAQIVQQLAIKTSQRRWWGLVVDDGEPRIVASGGEGAGLSSGVSGQRRALKRAFAARGRVAFDEPDARLSIDGDAGSGVVFPVRAGGRLCGLLAIESSRRRDFRDVDLERFASCIEHAGLALRLAQFRAWHRSNFGFDLWFDAERADFQLFAEHALAAARSRSAVVLSGAAGTGKLILARWLHFEGAGRAGPFKVFSCGRGSEHVTLADLLESAGGGTLLFDDLELLAPALQEELLRHLEGVERAASEPRRALGSGSRTCAEQQAARIDRDPALRIVATSRSGLSAAVEVHGMRHDLARRLDRLQLRLPAIKDRREDILPLVHCLVARFAAEEGVRVPVLTDEALALLWRQSWDGNLREIENVVYKIVLLHRHLRQSARDVIEPRAIAEIASMFPFELVRRLPSRHPQRSDLLAALRVTRKPGGKINKTRAALYLGWDPDTLVARMREAGIREDGPHAGDVWNSAAAQVAETTAPSGADASEPSADSEDGS